MPRTTGHPMQLNGIDIKCISPAMNFKYSPNLYRWLNYRRNDNMRQCSRVYCDDERTLWIGIPEGRHFEGQRLMSVLCHGWRAEVCFFLDFRRIAEVKGFWTEYLRVGRCAIDPEHVIGFIDANTSRWMTEGRHRKCLWCGAVKQRLIARRTTVTKHEWVTIDQRGMEENYA